MNKTFKKKYFHKVKGDLIRRQHILNKKFNLDCATKYKLNENGVLYAYDKYKVLMKSSYHIMGTYNKKTCVFRWGWGNPTLNAKVTHFSKRIIEFDENEDLFKINTIKIRGENTAFEFLVMLSTKSPNIEGYLIYKKPYSNILVYILLFNCKKTKVSLLNLLKNNIKNKRTKKYGC
jgi:hypothetical protein